VIIVGLVTNSFRILKNFKENFIYLVIKDRRWQKLVSKAIIKKILT